MKTHWMLFVLAGAVLSLDSTATAGFEQVHKLTASDAAADDVFGYSVGVSDNTVIAGAWLHDDGGTNSGSAYLFDAATGSQLHELIASDAAPEDRLGWSVGIDGNTAIVGAYHDDDAGSESGSAYLFDVFTGAQVSKLTASDAGAGDLFGWSVGISGNNAIVGACHDDDAGSDSGSAYIFDVGTGKQLSKLTASDAAAGDNFGRSVAISGNTAIVGAWADDDAGDASGSAYLFDLATGDQLAKLTASDAAPGDHLGCSVAISGDIAIVGAYGDKDAGIDSGAAYLFDVATADQLAKLTASDAAGGDDFGQSVAISINIAVVGACGDDDAGNWSGSTYLFDVATDEQLTKLTAADAAAYDRFGFSVGVSGDTVIVGAYWDDDGGSDSGSAYVFVPEPAALLLLAVGGLALVRRRRRPTRSSRA